MKSGVALHPGSPFKEPVKDAQVAERHGFSHVVVPNYKLLKDVYCTLTLIATATSTVKLGPCTANPYTRHPVVTAAAIASLNEISGGRAVLIIAQGGLATTKPLGLSRASSKEALRDPVAIIRGLWKNKTVNHSGLLRAENAKLEFKATESPLYMAATGPSMLELAGEVADGWDRGFCTLQGFKQMSLKLDSTCERAERKPKDVKRSMHWHTTLVGRNRSEVEKKKRRYVPPILEAKSRHPTRLMRDMPVEEYVQRRILVGTPEQIADQLSGFIDNVCDSLNFVFPDASAIEPLQLFAEGVLSRLR